MRQIEIVIRTLNRPSVCLETILYLRKVCRFKGKIIVVDQAGKGFQTVSDLAKREPSVAFGDVRYVNAEGPLGTAGAGNRGALASEAEWLLFVDDDVRPCCSAIENAIRLVDINRWVDGLVARVITERSRTADVSDDDCGVCRLAELEAEISDEPEKAIRESRRPLQFYWSSPTGRNARIWLNVNTSMFLIRRSAFFSVGGFDERFRGVGEDTDLGMRLWMSGCKLMYDPKFACLHLAHATGGVRSVRAKAQWMLDGLPDTGYLAVRYVWFPFEAESVVWDAARRICGRPICWPFVLFRLFELLRRRRKALGIAASPPILPFAR
jgi:GT2 family glycosyltransferase